MGYTSRSDDEDYCYPAERPWGMLSFEKQSYKVMELAHREIGTIQDYFEDPESHSGYFGINAETRYNKEYLPKYKEWKARADSQPIKQWLDSSKSYQGSKDFGIKDKVDLANSHYEQIIAERRGREFARTVKNAYNATETNWEKLQLFISTPTNPFQEQFSPEAIQSFRDSLSEGSGHYDNLKNLNSEKLFTEKPEPIYKNIDTDKIEEPWKRWLSVREKTEAIMRPRSLAKKINNLTES